ncbi:hypothetical protein GCM10011375_05290 [Hymenobacter qilianensis]|uniref:Uncharacterized protein n=2 Tax=Hymenobacter qilianensis TaxID=1385715 RepID=A0ACB5PMD9_9BACT|nr:hypothetical protein [Hymenobacter qilianensis]QNP53824.1 hypothetical protein H9L05_09990 [Hymenobacter qilianensis]GGF52721.1 hypothetical protein GCM10011375_05290 [Hymenobacter qilianensis]
MKIQYYLFAALLSLCACTKNDLDEVVLDGKGCIKRVTNAPGPGDHEIRKSEQATAVRLFQQNALSLSDLRFTQFIEEDLVVEGITNHHVHVKAARFANGLPFLLNRAIYNFRNGKYVHRSDNDFIAAADTKPALTLAQVRALFFQEFVDYNKQSTSYKAEDFKDKCLTAELGYYTLRGNETPIRTILAWHVKPKGEEYPEAVINDSDGTTIYFFDGSWTSMPR